MYSELIADYNERAHRNHVDINELMRIIPHREPMLMLDRIVDYDDDWAIGEKDIIGFDSVLKGHFPGNPLLPGTIQLEILSQVASFLILKKQEGKREGHFGLLFAEIRGIKFLERVEPNDTMSAFCRIKEERMGIYKVMCQGFAHEKKCVLGEMTFKLISNNPETE